jgi:hypothetical protein
MLTNLTAPIIVVGAIKLTNKRGKKVKKLNIENLDFWSDPQFIGTESYHNISINRRLVTSDGALSCFENNKCFWMGDVIWSYLPKINKINESLFVVYVVVKDNTADFYVTDGDYNVLIHQKIPYTDLTCNLKLFVGKLNQSTYVVYLPSEY